MLIFHDFFLRTDAERFAERVTMEFGLDAKVYDSQYDSDKVDWFPWALEWPIVLVERAEPWVEDQLEFMALEYTGEFAGT